MKAKKTKEINRKVKKQIKNDLEVNLKSKLSDFVKSLGHDAGEIGTEIKKISKLLARKLAGKVKNVKSISKLKDDKKGVASKAKAVKKEVAKSPEKVKKVIAKVAKKSGEKASNIEDIVKKEIINPAKVVLESKEETPAPAKKSPAVKKAAPVKKLSRPKAATQTITGEALATKSQTVKAAPAKNTSKTTQKSNTKPANTVKKGDN